MLLVPDSLTGKDPRLKGTLIQKTREMESRTLGGTLVGITCQSTELKMASPWFAAEFPRLSALLRESRTVPKHT